MVKNILWKHLLLHSSERMNRLIVMQKRLVEAKKRKRSASSVHISNSLHVSFSTNLNLQQHKYSIGLVLLQPDNQFTMISYLLLLLLLQLDSQLTSSPTQASLVQKRSKRAGTKKSLVWKHFDTGLRGQSPVAVCKYCGQVYACDRSTHGIDETVAKRLLRW